MRMYLAALVLGMFATVQTVSAAAPVFVSTADSMVQAIDEGSLYSDMVVATDADSGDVVMYSLLSGPSGMMVVDTTGAISWTPVQADVGTATVVISAADTSMAADTLTYDIVVSNVDFAPVINDTVQDSVDEDTQFSDQIKAADADGDAIVFTLLEGPDSMSIDSTSGTLSWMPTNEDVGNHDISIEAADTTGLADTVTYVLTVVNVNDLPEIDSYMPVAMDVYMTNGDSVVFTVNASDIDAGDALTYRWLADMLEVGTANSVKISAADTMVDVMVYVYDGTDSVSMAWTATFVADFADSISPMLDEVRYLTNATADMSDDVIEVTFTQDIDDSQLPGTFGELFEALESGLFDSSAIGTGEDANDNMIEIAVNAAYDTMPAQYEGMLALIDGSVFSTSLVPAKADTVDIALNLVMNTVTGEEYDHVQDALDDASKGDTLMVLGGYYEGVFNFEPRDGLLLMAVDGTEPTLAYSGDSVLTTSSWLGGSCFIKRSNRSTDLPTIDGFYISAVSSDSSVIGQSVQGVINFSNCTFYTTGSRNLYCRAGNGDPATRCVIENCEFIGGSQSVSLYQPYTEFRNNVIRDANYGGSWQGPIGLYLSGTSHVIVNNEFLNCGTQDPGSNNGCAIWVRDGSKNYIANNLFVENSRAYNGYSDDHREEMFVNNTVVNCHGNAFQIDGGTNCVFINNIITGSGGNGINTGKAGRPQDYQYNLVDKIADALIPTFADPAAVGNIIGADPMFVMADTSGYDLHLGVYSPAIDAGDPNTRDSDGYPCDMGAYGGQDAFDDERPGTVGGFSAAASMADSTDTLVWDDEGGSIYMYAVYRADASEGASFVPDSNNIVFAAGTTATVLPNMGTKWYYKINAIDTMGRAGGYAMTANASGPEAVLGVSELNFGGVDLDSTEILYVNVMNIGTDTLTISGAGVAGDSSAFYIDTAYTVAVRPNRTSLIKVYFNPTAYGSHADTLFIMTDDPDSSDMVQAVLLYGTVKQSVIGISDQAFSDTLDIDSTSSRSYYYINNSGDGVLTVDTLYFTGANFYFSDNISFPFNVGASGGQRRLSSYFSPVEGGAIADTLIVVSNDPTTPEARAVFTGQATSRIIDVFVAPTNRGLFTLEANPVSRTLGATIAIDVPRMVRVVLLDANGAFVAEVADGFMTAGTHQLRWNGQLNAGTYFLAVEGENAVQKVIVVE